MNLCIYSNILGHTYIYMNKKWVEILPILLFLNFFVVVIHVCECTALCVTPGVWKSETALRTWFSLSTVMWFWGSHSGGQAGMASTFPCWTISPSPQCYFGPQGYHYFLLHLTMSMYINPFIAWKKANEEKLNGTWLLNFSLAYYK